MADDRLAKVVERMRDTFRDTKGTASWRLVEYLDEPMHNAYYFGIILASYSTHRKYCRPKMDKAREKKIIFATASFTVVLWLWG